VIKKWPLDIKIVRHPILPTDSDRRLCKTSDQTAMTSKIHGLNGLKTQGLGVEDNILVVM